MNINFKFIELIEKKIEDAKKSGDKKLVEEYNDLLISLYKILEKSMN